MRFGRTNFLIIIKINGAPDPRRGHIKYVIYIFSFLIFFCSGTNEEF